MRITVLQRYLYSVCLVALLIAPRSINAEPTVSKDFYSQDYAGAPSIEQGVLRLERAFRSGVAPRYRPVHKLVATIRTLQTLQTIEQHLMGQDLPH